MSTSTEFLRGATAVLAHMNCHDPSGGTLYDEVVKYIGEAELIRQARKDGAMRWSGLSRYVRLSPRGHP